MAGFLLWQFGGHGPSQYAHLASSRGGSHGVHRQIQFTLPHPNAMTIKGGKQRRCRQNATYSSVSYLHNMYSPHMPELCAITGITSHHFEADTGDFLQGLPQGLQPFLLPLGILLGANHIDVMRNVVSSVITGLPLPLGEKPGGDLLWGRCSTFY